MKVKKLTRKDQQLLDYENMKLELYREAGRMEELRRIRNREYFPKELQKLKSIFEAIEEVQHRQIQLFTQIHRRKNRTFLNSSTALRLVSVFLLLLMVASPFHISEDHSPELPLSISKKTAPSLVPPKLPKELISESKTITEDKAAPSTTLKEPTKIALHSTPHNSNTLNDPVLEELLASNYRARSTPELKLTSNMDYLKISNLSDTLLHVELFDNKKQKLFRAECKDSLIIDKRKYAPEDGYYYRVKKENQLVHFGRL